MLWTHAGKFGFNLFSRPFRVIVQNLLRKKNASHLWKTRARHRVHRQEDISKLPEDRKKKFRKNENFPIVFSRTPKTKIEISTLDK
jgi:hypothetical protein